MFLNTENQKIFKDNMKGISTVVATILMLVITIALAGTAMMYMRSTVQQTTQGIQVLGTTCSNSNVTMTIKNIGTINTTINHTNCIQMTPAAAAGTCTFTLPTPFPTGGVVLEPGVAADFTEQCGTPGTSKTCIYKIIPGAGQSVDVSVFCPN